MEKIAGHRYKYNKETKDYDSDIGFDNKDLFLHIGILQELNTPIIIEEQEEIEIIGGWGLATDYKDFETINHTLDRFGNKINELVQAVKQLDKNIKEKQ